MIDRQEAIVLAALFLIALAVGHAIYGQIDTFVDARFLQQLR